MQQKDHVADATKRMSTGATAAVVSLIVISLIGGWLILLDGGFSHQVGKHSRETTYVSGPPAFIMASIMFAMSSIGVGVLVQNMKRRSKFRYLVGVSIVIVPPIVYRLLHS